MDQRPRTFALAGAAATSLALLAGAGERAPSLVELLGALTLLAGTFWLRGRLARPPAPTGVEVSLVTLGILWLGGAAILGGHAGALVTGEVRLALVRLLALLASSSFGLALLAPRLARDTAQGMADAPTAGHGRDLALVFAVGAVFHAFVFFTYPPLVLGDSFSNLTEPRVLQYSPGRTFHHPPVYTELVTFLGAPSPNVLGWLTALVIFQHGLVLALGLAAQHAVHSATGSRFAGVVTGLAIVLESQLALYAQAVLSETVAVAWLVFAFALLLEATRRSRAGPWLFCAGIGVAMSTLTRQVSELWCVVAASWIFALGLVTPRVRAAAIFLAGALLPIVLVIGHNAVFTARAGLTSATGRNLIYRAVVDMPPLTDPTAAPGDRIEQARRLVWEKRETAWSGPYYALLAAGWSDAEIDALFTRFYLEQARKNPGHFAAVTLRYVWALFSGSEPFGAVAAVHNATRLSDTPPGWEGLPAAEEKTPGAIQALADLELPVRLVLLGLTLVAALASRGRARALALLALASVLYFLVLSALVELPVQRYRLPAVPFLAIGGGAGLARLLELARRSPGAKP